MRTAQELVSENTVPFERAPNEHEIELETNLSHRTLLRAC